MRCSSGSSASVTGCARLILSAILPLNQYMTKLKITAIAANRMSPPEPPTR